jgi:hypothetical protein
VRAAILLVALAGCALGDEKVSKHCTKAADCFQAQGEFCNTTTNECEVMPDAGTALESPDETETQAELEAEAHHE